MVFAYSILLVSIGLFTYAVVELIIGDRTLGTLTLGFLTLFGALLVLGKAQYEKETETEIRHKANLKKQRNGFSSPHSIRNNSHRKNFSGMRKKPYYSTNKISE